MSDEQINNSNNHTGADNGNGGQETDYSNLPLKDAIGKALGKEFPDDKTAIKSVQDTFSAVGKTGKFQKAVEAVMSARGLDEETAVKLITSELGVKKETSGNDNQTKVDDKNFVSREEFDESNFYSEHSDMKPYKNLIETFKKANPGKTRTEILELPDFKDLFDKIKAQDEGKQKSILHSNPRVGKGADKMTQAQDSLKSGDQKGAEDLAVKSVTESFEV